jgi:hypothetical protein
MNNFTLANNLNQVAPAQEPFAGASPLTDKQVMQHPFPDIQVGAMQSDLASQPTMSEVQKPIDANADFPTLAKQFNIDLKGLSKNRDVGGLQLMKRMQQVFGTGFQKHKAFDPLMRAWQSYSMPQQQPEDVASATKAERTLGAIMGL